MLRRHWGPKIRAVSCEGTTLTNKGNRSPHGNRVGIYQLYKLETKVDNLDCILKIISLKMPHQVIYATKVLFYKESSE